MQPRPPRSPVKSHTAVLAAIMVFAALWLLEWSRAQSYALTEHGYLPLVARRWPPPTPTPSPGRLVISEVMLNPPGNEPEGEWIEIFNAGDLSITLAGYKIGDAVHKGENEAMYRLPDGLMLQGGEARVIANHTLEFRLTYPFDPDFEINDSTDQIPELVRYTDWSEGPFSLANSGDEIIILDASDSLVDAIAWGNSLEIFYPPANPGDEGESLERYPGHQDTDSALDWRVQGTPNPGEVVIPPPTPTSTPTIRPTQTSTPTVTPTITPIPAIVINEIHADPHPSLGDANGDGIVSLLQDEFIEIVNITGEIADISGWELRNTMGARHIIPDGTVLPDRCSIVIFGGGAPVGIFGHSLVQVASAGSLDLFNTGDTLLLVDANGFLIVSSSYGPLAEDNQSITRSPDITGLTWVKHSLVPGANQSLFSPGTMVNGTHFSGCPTR